MSKTKARAKQQAPVVEEPPKGKVPKPSTERELQLRVRQQQILADLGVKFLSGIPFAELLDEIVRGAAEGLEAEFCKLVEYLPSEDRLLVRAGVGWRPGLVGVAKIAADLESPSGFALRTGQPVVSNHLEQEERFRTPELLALHGIRRAINVIVQGQGTPYGVLEVDSSVPGKFTERDITFLQGAADIVGMAIERQHQEKMLRAALERQNLLMREINHRVKNSLQLVASMLSLQAGIDPAAQERLKEASRRVTAIARAHDRLYRTDDVERINMCDYLSGICRDLAEATPNAEIVYQPTCDATEPVFLDVDRAVAVALSVSELVTNAAKHAYPNAGRGRIWVTSSRAEEGIFGVSVRDEGVGLPAGFESDDRRTGLGFRLIEALAKQTGAQLQIRRLPRGTDFEMLIPVHRR